MSHLTDQEHPALCKQQCRSGPRQLESLSLSLSISLFFLQQQSSHWGTSHLGSWDSHSHNSIACAGEVLALLQTWQWIEIGAITLVATTKVKKVALGEFPPPLDHGPCRMQAHFASTMWDIRSYFPPSSAERSLCCVNSNSALECQRK